MDKTLEDILGYIINSIQPKQDFDPKNKRGYHEICYEICQVAQHTGYPFVSINEEMFLFTGTNWDNVDSHTIKVFIKYAYGKLCGDSVAASKKDTINGLVSQLPYTAMILNVKQAVDKINFQNGTLNLNTMGLARHDWKDYFRYMLPYGYDPVADCPMFRRYLDEVMPEKKAQDVLAEYIGWLFIPELKLEKVLFLYGSGCNGKSVFVEIIEALVGKGNVSHESLSDLCGEYGANSRANLSGKLLNTCSDVAPNAFAGDLFKRLASREPISMKTLYKDVITTDEYARMLFCLNELPRTNDISNGFYRRFLIAPFKIQIPKARIDPELSKKIIASELPGIMNWALEGRKRLVTDKKFTESPIMNRALEEYRSRNTKKKRSLLLPPFFKAS